MHVYVYVSLSLSLYIYIYVHAYIYTLHNVCVYIYIYICIHTCWLSAHNSTFSRRGRRAGDTGPEERRDAGDFFQHQRIPFEMKGLCVNSIRFLFDISLIPHASKESV